MSKGWLSTTALMLLLATPAAGQQTGGAKPADDQSGQQQAGTFIERQGEDQLRADELTEAKVFNEGGEDLGDIEDLLLEQDGRVAAVMVAVGGFLGIGEKSVAIPFEELGIARGDAIGSPIQVTLQQNRETLERAPDFRNLQEVQAEEQAVATREQMVGQQTQGQVADAMRAVQEAEAALAEQNQKGAQEALQEARRLLEIAAQPVGGPPIQPAAGPAPGDQPEADEEAAQPQ